jgi:kynurenine formamidase
MTGLAPAAGERTTDISRTHDDNIHGKSLIVDPEPTPHSADRAWHNRYLNRDALEVAPNPDKQISLPVHQIALVVNGVHLLENLKLDELAAKGVSEFAFIMEPLKIQGGTGSTVAPIAVR